MRKRWSWGDCGGDASQEPSIDEHEPSPAAALLPWPRVGEPAGCFHRAAPHRASTRGVFSQVKSCVPTGKRLACVLTHVSPPPQVMTGFTLHNVEDRLIVARALEQSLGHVASGCPPAEQLTVPQPTDGDFQQTPASVHKYLVSLEQRVKQLEKARAPARPPPARRPPPGPSTARDRDPPPAAAHPAPGLPPPDPSPAGP